MKRVSVKSGHIVSIGYDAGDKRLEIEFADGKVYSYAACENDLFAKFLNADSKGKFFAHSILGKYASKRIEEGKCKT